MIKKFFLILLWLSTFVLGGCWNYRSLSEMSIIAGIAIDINPANQKYLITYEMIDVAGPVKETGVSTKLIEAEGKTLFDAARNAKKRTMNKLYFSHADTLIISEEVAKKEGMNALIDWFLRDAEWRETVCIVISQEKTARELLHAQGIAQQIKSYEIREILKTDRQVTAATYYIELYNVYNVLHGKGVELAVPAMHLVTNDNHKANEVNGIAVFKKGFLKGYLSPDETKFFLYAAEKINGGLLLSVSSKGGGKDDTTLEVSKNKTQRSYVMKNGKIVIKINTETTVFLDETEEPLDSLDKERIREFETNAQIKLAQGIGDTIKKVQSEFGSDIFGFGNLIYKHDSKLWEKLSGNWDEIFKTLTVEIKTKVNIENTALLKKTESE